RDHFESMRDVFDMFRVIVHERKKREIDPTLQVLQRCIVEAGKPKSADRYIRERLTDLLQFFELAETAYLQLEKLPTTALLKLAKTGDKALRLLGMAKRRSEEHTSELQSLAYLVCRLLLEKKKAQPHPAPPERAHSLPARFLPRGDGWDLS